MKNIIGFVCGAGLFTAISPFGACLAEQAGGSGGASGGSGDGYQLEEVIVTAERRESDVQKTAASIEVRSGEDLNRQGRFSLAQILEDVPGVTVNTGAGVSGDAPGTAVIVRGVIPNTASAGNAVVPTTAVYTDGVYSGVGGGYDIERVEVLRGPQGTLYGRSATAGVLAVRTHDPVLGTFAGSAAAEFGNYSLGHHTAVVNVPLGESVAVRVAGNYYSRDGFISNDGGNNKIVDGKVKVLFKPGDDFSLLLGGAAQDGHPNSGGATLSLTPPGTFNVATIPHPTADTFYAGPVQPVFSDNENRQRQLWAELNWNLGIGTLTYLPAYRTYFENNMTAGAGPAGPNGVRFSIASITQTPTDRFQTHELRLASLSGSPVTWLIGALYYRNNVENSSDSYVNDGSRGRIFLAQTAKVTTDTGAFGEVTLPFAQARWRVTGGMRYDRTQVKGSEVYTVASNPFGLAPVPNVISSLTLPPGAGDSDFNNVTYRARLETDLTPVSLLYAMVSTGFLPGDIQVTTVGFGPNVTAGAVRYDQEKLTAYEVGSKNRFLDNRLQINGDVYYYDYTGYQASTLTSPFNPSFAIVTSPARMYGAELDAAFQLTVDDRLGLSYGHTKATFVNKPSCPASTTNVCFAEVISNDGIANVPPDILTLSYDHSLRFSGGSRVDLRLDGRYRSDYDATYLLPAHVPYEPYVHVDPQWIGNLSLTFTSAGDRYSVTGYVRNAGDDAYKNGAQLSGLATTFSATGTRYDPRTVGVILRAGF